tara:strand:+ start:72 stop:1340 length:1269 start_codon:yes stop_codon:yes gene_type:complete
MNSSDASRVANTNTRNFEETIGSATKVVQQKIKSLSSDGYLMITLLIIFCILFALGSWIYNTLSLKEKACKNLETTYKNTKYKSTSFMDMGGLNIKPSAIKSSGSLNYFDDSNSCLVRNYYVKTAYNCCCGDGYKNNFVNLCALENCIELGARCLDFEIYSYNSEPIVAASTANNNSIKETYNYLLLSDVFDVLNKKCFNTDDVGSPYEPMFLHFRIMSENSVIYDKIGDYINDRLNVNGNRLLDSKFNYKNSSVTSNITLQKISDPNIMSKFIIIVNTLYSSTLNNSKLANYVNFKSGSSDFKLLRYEDIIAQGSNNQLVINDSHVSLIMVLPNISSDTNNYDPLVCFNNGCQFVGMKFQNLDSNLSGYLKMFRNSGNYPFVLKPYKLRRDLLSNAPVARGVEQSVTSLTIRGAPGSTSIS